IHSGLNETDSQVKTLVDSCLGMRPYKTYNTSVMAMALEEANRVKYQGKIFQCAQFLVDNQAKNGQWDYGTAFVMGEPPPGRPAKPPAATPAKKTKGEPRGPLADKP